MTGQALTENPRLSQYAMSSVEALLRSRDALPRSSGRTLSKVDVREQTAATPTLTAETEPKLKLNGNDYRLFSKDRASRRTDKVGIDEALVALRAVLHQADEAGWVRASRLLRRSAIEENSRSPRYATLALAVSDALAFTTPAEVKPSAKQPLAEAFDLLRAPFIPGDAEEAVFQGLLDSGWHVTAPFDPDEWAGVAE